MIIWYQQKTRLIGDQHFWSYPPPSPPPPLLLLPPPLLLLHCLSIIHLSLVRSDGPVHLAEAASSTYSHTRPWWRLVKTDHTYYYWLYNRVQTHKFSNGDQNPVSTIKKKNSLKCCLTNYGSSFKPMFEQCGLEVIIRQTTWVKNHCILLLHLTRQNYLNLDNDCSLNDSSFKVQICLIFI